MRNVLKYPSGLPKEEALDSDHALNLQLAQRVLTKLRSMESVVRPALQENGGGSLLAVLGKYQSLSQPAKSRTLPVQRKKEVESYSYYN